MQFSSQYDTRVVIYERKMLLRLVTALQKTLTLPRYGKLTSFLLKARDSDLDSRLRDEVVQLMCSLEYRDCVEKATEAFDQWTNPRRARGSRACLVGLMQCDQKKIAKCL